MSLKRHLFITLIFVVFSCCLLAQQPVKLYEEEIEIPTYLVGAPEKLPIFYSGRAYQGAEGHVYPYPFMDKLIGIKKNKVYKAVYLENEYIKVCVLPEIGGRIFQALDKTNNYDFFYHQHVIKPALIGMLGAWISGGVEWNVPHHHRASTFMPVDYKLVNNPDGSKTVWVGELEIRHRMRWIVGLTLYPDKSYIKVTGKLFNRTPLTHSFLFWANIAVHSNDNYQAIFPPRTEYATYHGKNEFSEWPVSHQVYRGIDYTEGVDVSWWKNYPAPTSFFAWNYEDDFLAGYDHGKEAGMVSVANHHIVPGKKVWNWGPNPRGNMWEKILTDKDGPYLELMVGAYSDNQPDYSWCQPFMVKTFEAYWYPIRNINDVKNANKNATVNLDISSKKQIGIGFNTTAQYKNATVVLKEDKNKIFEEKIDISPDKPYWKKIKIFENVDKDNLEVSLYDSNGNELISYKPVKKPGEPMPEVVEPPLPPEEIDSIEELYLTGLRIEQFYNPALEPYPYYEEALRRDSKDYRTNVQLATLYLKRGKFKDAEKHLRTALKRVSKNYTSPKDCEAYYYLGLALKYQKKYKEAYDVFYKAVWSYHWYSQSYYNLAEIDCIKENLKKALKHLDKSILMNNLNTKAKVLKAGVLRRLKKFDITQNILSEVLDYDQELPRNFSCKTYINLICW